MTKNNLLSLCDNFLNNKNSFIGFTDFFDDLTLFDNRLTEMGIKDSYPPYDIYTKDIDVSAEDEDEIMEKHTFIELACAGFKKDELSIKFDEDNSVLTITGRISDKNDSNENNYSYKGIATRMFVREWKLSEKLQFVKASYVDGILKIEFMPKVMMCSSSTTLPID